MQTSVRKDRPERDPESGLAIVVALLVMLIVVVLSTGIGVTSRGSVRVSTAFKNQQVAFEAAVAGLEHAREAIRRERYVTPADRDYDRLLTAARNGGTLVAANSLGNFGATNGFTNTTANAPVVASMTPAGATNGSRFQVFLNNDATEGLTNANDENDIITLTSFGSGPGQIGFSVVQATYRTDPGVTVPRLPALLTIPGRTVNIDLPNGNASTMDGNGGGTPPTCYASIAISTTTAASQVSSAMTRPNNFTTCNPSGGGTLTGMSSVDNFINGTNPFDATTNTPVLQSGDTQLNFVSYLQGLVAQISAAADVVHTGSSNSGVIGLGTQADPRVVVVDGDFEISGSVNGYGALVVTGKLTMNGTPGYHGPIYVIGKGHVERKGGGNGLINCGGMLIANTVVPDTTNSALVGTPTYEINGGGNSTFTQCPANSDGDNIRFSRRLERLSFQQLR